MRTHIGPIQVIINPGLTDEFTIGREHQLEDATLTINDMMAEHQTQQSEAPADKSFTGLEASLEISISEITLNFYRKATNPARYTVGNGAEKVEYGDLTGLRVPKRKILIKPYDGFFPTTLKDDWFTFLNAGIETEASLSFGKATQSAYTMRIVAYPDVTTGMKIVRGDATATGNVSGLAVDASQQATEPEPTAVASGTEPTAGEPITLTAVI